MVVVFAACHAVISRVVRSDNPTTAFGGKYHDVISKVVRSDNPTTAFGGKCNDVIIKVVRSDNPTTAFGGKCHAVISQVVRSDNPTTAFLEVNVMLPSAEWSGVINQLQLMKVKNLKLVLNRIST